MSSHNSVTSPTLIKALERHGGSNREIAENSGVSFRGVSEARNGLDREDLKSKRKQYGVAESMTRLANYLGVDPETVVKELGLSLDDATVRRYMGRALTEPTRAERTDDYVLQSVRARELARKRPKGPIVGLVEWKPFFDGEPGGNSSAVKLLRSILGSVDPEWVHSDNFDSYEDFSAAEADLLSNDPEKPQLLMGVYDIPWRRREGVDVIPLPGLRVELGGLSDEEGLTWKDVLTSSGKDPEWKPPKCLVIEGDAGSILLRGSADYPSGQFVEIPLETRNPAKIAERIASEVESESRHSDGFLFVADGALVSTVEGYLKHKFDTEMYGMTRHWAPSYRFGIGLHPDSKRFADILHEAFVQELFGRVLPRTAQTYLDLFRSDQHNRLRLRPAELEGLGHNVPERFLRAIMEGMPRDEEGMPGDEWEKFCTNAIEGHEGRFWMERLKSPPSAPPSGAPDHPTGIASGNG